MLEAEITLASEACITKPTFTPAGSQRMLTRGRVRAAIDRLRRGTVRVQLMNARHCNDPNGWFWAPQ